MESPAAPAGKSPTLQTLFTSSPTSPAPPPAVRVMIGDQHARALDGLALQPQLQSHTEPNQASNSTPGAARSPSAVQVCKILYQWSVQVQRPQSWLSLFLSFHMWFQHK